MIWTVPKILDVQIDAGRDRMSIRYDLDRPIPSDGRVLHLLMTGVNSGDSTEIGFGLRFVNGVRENYYQWGGSHQKPESDRGEFHHRATVIIANYSGSWIDELGEIPTYTAATFSEGYAMQDSVPVRPGPATA